MGNLQTRLSRNIILTRKLRIRRFGWTPTNCVIEFNAPLKHTYWMKSQWSWKFLTLYRTPPPFLIGLCFFFFFWGGEGNRFLFCVYNVCIDVRGLSLLFTCIVLVSWLYFFVCIWLLWIMYFNLCIGPLWRTAFGWIGQSNPWVVNR